MERTKKLKIGNPMEDGVKVGATICKMQYDKILNYLDIARKEGAEVLCGGGPVTPDNPDLAVSLCSYVFCTVKFNFSSKLPNSDNVHRLCIISVFQICTKLTMIQ